MSPPAKLPPFRGKLPSLDSDRPVAPGHERDVFQTILGVEQRLSDKIDDASERARKVDEDHERRITMVEKGLLQISTVDIKIDNLREKIDEARRSDEDLRDRLLDHSKEDLVTARQIGEIKAELARDLGATAEAAGVESGHAAGAAAAKRWGWIAILGSVIVAVIDRLGPIILQALNQ